MGDGIILTELHAGVYSKQLLVTLSYDNDDVVKRFFIKIA